MTQSFGLRVHNRHVGEHGGRRQLKLTAQITNTALATSCVNCALYRSHQHGVGVRSTAWVCAARRGCAQHGVGERSTAWVSAALRG